MPDLCSINDETKKRNLIQIDQENWDEGTDSKSKAFRWLREQKDIMFDQNKEWVKFRKIFKGLKRTQKRAHKPNKLTEYDIPVDTRVRGVTGAKGAECGFDPDEVLQREFALDEAKEKEMIKQLYGSQEAPEEPEDEVHERNPFEIAEPEQPKADHNLFKLSEFFLTNEARGILGVQ